jgi:hypothetical protein
MEASGEAPRVKSKRRKPSKASSSSSTSDMSALDAAIAENKCTGPSTPAEIFDDELVELYSSYRETIEKKGLKAIRAKLLHHVPAQSSIYADYYAHQSVTDSGASSLAPYHQLLTVAASALAAKTSGRGSEGSTGSRKKGARGLAREYVDRSSIMDAWRAVVSALADPQSLEVEAKDPSQFKVEVAIILLFFHQKCGVLSDISMFNSLMLVPDLFARMISLLHVVCKCSWDRDVIYTTGTSTSIAEFALVSDLYTDIDRKYINTKAHNAFILLSLDLWSSLDILLRHMSLAETTRALQQDWVWYLFRIDLVSAVCQRVKALNRQRLRLPQSSAHSSSSVVTLFKSHACFVAGILSVLRYLYFEI